MEKIITTIILLSLFSSVFGKDLFEFEVGMSWEYRVSGKQSYNVVNRISMSKMINGKMWFQLTEYGEKFWVRNSPQGQVEAINLNETDAEKTDDLGVELIFKFPAKSGETWLSYGSLTKYIGIQEMNVPAGKFMCHMYHMDLGGGEYSDTCIAEGVGVIYNEAVLNGNEKEVSRLIKYEKNHDKSIQTVR